MPAVLLVILGIFALLALVGWIAESSSDVAQAVAVSEVAKAAQIAAQGQRQATGAVVLLSVLLVLVVLGAVAFCIFIYLQHKRAERERAATPAQKWLPGPNANFGQVNQPQLDTGALNTMVNLEIIRALREMRGYSLPAPQQNEHPAPAMLPSGIDSERWW
jgi:1,4-dihydroxy-2-naphthoate octaprenyltransferase